MILQPDDFDPPSRWHLAHAAVGAMLITAILVLVAFLMTGCSPVSATQFGDVTRSPIAPFTENSALLYQDKDGNWVIKVVKVPSMSSHLPYVCFGIKDNRAIECFYIGDDEVIQRGVILDEVKV